MWTLTKDNINMKMPAGSVYATPVGVLAACWLRWAAYIKQLQHPLHFRDMPRGGHFARAPDPRPLPVTTAYRGLAGVQNGHGAATVRNPSRCQATLTAKPLTKAALWPASAKALADSAS